MGDQGYTVRLDAFEGPLDLLLHLIRRAEVDVADIPIAQITDQYLRHLESIDTVDIDRAGEFLVMAATLTEIKSRMIAGGGRVCTEERPDSSEDPRADLVRQLLAYKRFRDAAGALELRLESWRLRFPAGRAHVESGAIRSALGEPETDLEDLSVIDLVEAFARVCETTNFERLGEHEVVADETPIELHAEDVRDSLRRVIDGGSSELSLRSLFSGRTKAEMIGLFLALLEMVRRREVRVRVSGVDADVWLSPREPETDESPAGGAGPA